MLVDDRILLIDLKDWYGKIESENGRWFHNNHDVGPSPVEEVRGNARKLGEVLRGYLQTELRKNGTGFARAFVPFIQGCVVLTGDASAFGISANEKSSVVSIDELIRALPDPNLRAALIGPPEWIDRTNSVVEANGYRRRMLGKFFNIQTGPFTPRRRLYGNYQASSDDSTYDHRNNATDGGGVDREYDAEENAPGRAPGLLRVWDFSRAATRFQTEAGRREIAGRERDVIAYLKDRNAEFDVTLLQPKAADHDNSVNYWKVFEKRHQWRRLRNIKLPLPDSVSDQTRLDLAKALLLRVKALHDLDASHLDLGPHSVWIEQPSTVKLSHLLAASYPTLQSLGEARSVSNITRLNLLQMAGVSAGTLLAPSIAGSATLSPKGILVSHPVVPPTPLSADHLSFMREAGLLAVVQRDGWQYNSNGTIMRPNSNCPKSHHTLPLSDCGCSTGGGVTCYEPGGGNAMGYPVIGSVAVNYGNNYWQGAIFTGDVSPYGPHIGLPQMGWGTQFIVSPMKCMVSSLGQMITAAGTMVAYALNHPNWSSQIEQAAVKALAKWGAKGRWGIAAAVDFFISISADLIFATLFDFILAAGIGYGVFEVVPSVIHCTGGLRGWQLIQRLVWALEPSFWRILRGGYGTTTNLGKRH